MRRECRERFPRPPRVSDPDMHHGTCVTHVPWCMPGSVTSGFLWSRWLGKRSRHPRRMRNPQCYVSGKRPIWAGHITLHCLKQRGVRELTTLYREIICSLCYTLDMISIMTHSIAYSFFISFLHDASRKIRHLCEFPLLLGDVTTWKTFRNTLVFCVGNPPVTGQLSSQRASNGDL